MSRKQGNIIDANSKDWEDKDDEHQDLEDYDNYDDYGDEEEEVVVEEDIEEMQEIEAKLESGEDLSATPSETSMLLKTRVLYSCARCRKIYFKNKWIKDSVTDIYTVRTELAYCDTCLKKTDHDFIGSVEIYDKKLKERKKAIIDLAKNVEVSLENRQPFENIIEITEENNILYIFVNTTHLAADIARALRHEWHGSVQYEWFERNQFLRAKWFSEIQNREHFKNSIRASKEKRIGLFSFEDDF